MSYLHWAIVDIETTGLHVTHDSITEIAVQVISEQRVINTWHRLIKPKHAISDTISALTGITNAMVENAPSFEDIALELLEVFEGCVFVAHNARFDYGFIKNAFKKCQISFQVPVLCTIKLVKHLHPKLPQYNLEYLAQLLDIPAQAQHRAQADVAVLYEIILKMVLFYTLQKVQLTARAIYQKSSIPSKLITDISQFPDSPGVYIFFAENNALPLYIGKSITLRQRVLSHFSSDYTHAKEFALSQQVVRVDIIPTAGELSALLLESEMIKTHMPIYNRKLRRKKTIVGFVLQDIQGYLAVSIVRKQVEEESTCRELYGAFRSVVSAKRALVQLIKAHNLCPKLCGVEQGRGSCFSYQLKRCKGGCVQEEPASDYNKRLIDALKVFDEVVWPYDGAIAIKEHCPVNKILQFSIFHKWRYLGSVASICALKQWRTLLNASQTCHTYDAYKIVLSYLKGTVPAENIIVLE